VKEPPTPKVSFFARAKLSYMEKQNATSEKFKSRFPSAHEKASGYLKEFKDVWAETFPHQKSVT